MRKPDWKPTMPRFFFENPTGRPPRVDERVTLDPDECRHLLTVLRTEPGTAVTLTDGRGHTCAGVLETRGRNACTLRITAVAFAETEIAAPRLHLACAIVKGRRFESALEKAVELGVHVLTPLATDQGVVDPRAGKRERWAGLVVAALKQSDRCYLPQLRPPAAPAAVLAAAAAAGAEAWFGSAPIETPASAPLTMLQAAERVAGWRREGRAVPPELLLLIGPEGGWSAAELALFASHRARPLTFGPHVLRTETAALAGLTVLQQLRAVWRT